MRHILALSSSRLLAQHTVSLYSSLLGVVTLVGLLEGQKHTGPGFIIVCCLQACIYIIIYNHELLNVQYLDFGSGPFPVVFRLQVGQDVTPLFVVQGGNIRIFVVDIILHGYSNTVLSLDVDLIFS